MGLKKEETQALLKQLNRSVDILESTFSDIGVQLLGYGFCSVKERGNLEINLEIALEPGKALENSFIIKINFYDEDNAIIYSKEEDIFMDCFSGYDTINMYLDEDNLAFNTAKSRIFAVKSLY